MGSYQRCLSSAVVEYLQEQTWVKVRRWVYSAAVVIWLMIRQRLQAQGTHGRAHWPLLRIVVLHELESGLAEEPQWGPLYGPAAVREQTLAEKAMDALAPGSVLGGIASSACFRSSGRLGCGVWEWSRV